MNREMQVCRLSWQQVFRLWSSELCYWVSGFKHLEGTYCLHHQVWSESGEDTLMSYSRLQERWLDPQAELCHLCFLFFLSFSLAVHVHCSYWPRWATSPLPLSGSARPRSLQPVYMPWLHRHNAHFNSDDESMFWNIRSCTQYYTFSFMGYFKILSYLRLDGVEWYDDWWIGKDIVAHSHSAIKVLPWHLPEETEENYNTSVRIPSVPADIQTNNSQRPRHSSSG
jgi:hypothetical protein